MLNNLPIVIKPVKVMRSLFQEVLITCSVLCITLKMLNNLLSTQTENKQLQYRLTAKIDTNVVL